MFVDKIEAISPADFNYAVLSRLKPSNSVELTLNSNDIDTLRGVKDSNKIAMSDYFIIPVQQSNDETADSKVLVEPKAPIIPKLVPQAYKLIDSARIDGLETIVESGTDSSFSVTIPLEGRNYSDVLSTLTAMPYSFNIVSSNAEKTIEVKNFTASEDAGNIKLAFSIPFSELSSGKNRIYVGTSGKEAKIFSEEFYKIPDGFETIPDLVSINDSNSKMVYTVEKDPSRSLPVGVNYFDKDVVLKAADSVGLSAVDLDKIGVFNTDGKMEVLTRGDKNYVLVRKTETLNGEEKNIVCGYNLLEEQILSLISAQEAPKALTSKEVLGSNEYDLPEPSLPDEPKIFPFYFSKNVEAGLSYRPTFSFMGNTGDLPGVSIPLSFVFDANGNKLWKVGTLKGKDFYVGTSGDVVLGYENGTQQSESGKAVTGFDGIYANGNISLDLGIALNKSNGPDSREGDSKLVLSLGPNFTYGSSTSKDLNLTSDMKAAMAALGYSGEVTSEMNSLGLRLGLSYGNNKGKLSCYSVFPISGSQEFGGDFKSKGDYSMSEFGIYAGYDFGRIIAENLLRFIDHEYSGKMKDGSDHEYSKFTIEDKLRLGYDFGRFTVKAGIDYRLSSVGPMLDNKVMGETQIYPVIEGTVKLGF